MLLWFSMVIIYMMLHTVPRMNVLPLLCEFGQSHYYRVLGNQEQNNASCFHAQDISKCWSTMLTGQPQILTFSRLLQELRMSCFPAWGVTSWSKCGPKKSQRRTQLQRTEPPKWWVSNLRISQIPDICWDFQVSPCTTRRLEETTCFRTDPKLYCRQCGIPCKTYWKIHWIVTE